MPTEDQTVSRVLPDEPGFKNDTEYKKKYEEIKAQIEALTKEGKAAQAKLQEGQNVEPTISAEEEFSPTSELVKPAPVPDRALKTYYKPIEETVGSEAPLVFQVSQKEFLGDNFTVLPVGSFVKARVLSGVEANTLEPYPVLLQLEYAFTGPNQSQVDLSNCFMIAKARANLSTERVIMQTETISCVTESGEHFKSEAKGYTAGTDSTFGSTGTFISKQGQVLLAAVLANIAKNAGEALATAQQTTTVSGSDRAATATNVTGSQGAFIAGRSAVDAGAMIAQWYLDYARQLIPSIAIGSGESVHVVMLETIKVPTL